MIHQLRVRTAFFLTASLAVLSCLSIPTIAQEPQSRPRVIVIGVNGMEWDIIRPLLIKGEMPNLAGVIQRGVYGKMQTLPSPNCPKVYTTLATSAPPEENGITGFVVGGATASTAMLKREPLWSILSRNGISVGLANVPATFPAMPVNGYTVSGMLTRGKGCENGILCSPRLSEVIGGDAVYPVALAAELKAKVGDFAIDCARMPLASELQGPKKAQTVEEWLDRVSRIRAQQTALFEYLLTHHPTDFTMLAQSCEDRVGHWLYPIQPYNVGYDSTLHTLRVDAFPDQYRAFDRVLGRILLHVDKDTYVFIVSDHGIKPLREFEELRLGRYMAHDHGGTTPVIAKHDFEDGDDVPGSFIAMGPRIRKDVHLMGFAITVFDIAPTILSLYGVPIPNQMRGRVLKEIFEEPSALIPPRPAR